MSTLKEQVGAIIRHHRRQRGWSQDQLAIHTDRSIEMINRIERGRVAPSFDTLEALADALQVPVRDLFGAGPHAAGSRTATPLVKLIDRVSGLDGDDLNWVDDLVRVALARKVRSPAAR